MQLVRDYQQIYNILVATVLKKKWSTLIIPISVCGTNSQIMHYIAKYQN